MRRAFVAMLLVTAGCNGLVPGGGPADTPTVTPAPVPEASPTDDPERLGVSELTDGRELARAHAENLRNASFTVVANRTATYWNGSLHSRLRIRLQAASDGQTYRASVAVAGPGGPVFLGRPPAAATFWSDGETYVRRFDTGNRTVYNRFSPSFGYAGTRAYWLEIVALDGTPRRDVAETFGSFRLRVTDRSDVGGTTVYRLVGSAPQSRGFVDDNEDVGGVRNASLTARVTEGGLVRSYRVTYTAETPTGAVVNVVRRIRYERVGATTVTRPSWYDRAVGNESNGTRDTPEREPAAALRVQ